MKILVLGAGAVGGYFGGRMAEAGADVTFLVRPKRADSIAKDGLRIRGKSGDLTLAAKCVLAGKVGADYDVVMLTAKAYDLPDAMDAIAPAIAGRAFVWPLLNGMSHLEALDAKFGAAKVLGGVAYISSTLATDGTILHLNDFHRVVFGPRSAGQHPICDALSQAMLGVKFDWKQLDNVEQAMWDKWVMLATMAGMTCLMRGAVGDILAAQAGEKLMLQLVAECAAVAKAEGYATPDGVMKNYHGMMTARGSTITASMLRDVESGGKAEGDHVLGALLARARKHGLATPLLEIATTHLETYVARRKREAAS
jgi:2-dehydropantoate 2-reductase